MTQSPFGGAASAPMGAASATSDFGATTLSGNRSDRGAVGSPAAAGGSAATAKNTTNARATRPRGPRRARLQLRHVGPLTVLKFSSVLAIALFFVWLIMIGVLYGVLDRAGVIERINSTIQTINGASSKPPVTAHIVFEVAAIIGAINVVLFVALATIGSVIYNLCADLVGGVEVTLSER